MPARSRTANAPAKKAATKRPAAKKPVTKPSVRNALPSGLEERMSTLTEAGKVNLSKWIRANKDRLAPPVSNKQMFAFSKDAIVFVSGGPNTRNDFHVNPTEELFYQLKGDIAVRVRPLDGSPVHDVIVKEGEIFLLPQWVPHRPQRPKNTLGLVIEFPRPAGTKDGLRWYCPKCDNLVYEASFRLNKIDEDLAIVMEDFWGGPQSRRTCSCGYVIQRAPEFAMKSKTAAKARRSPR